VGRRDWKVGAARQLSKERHQMKLSVEMTLNAETAQRLRETAERLLEADMGNDGHLAATVLMRIARNYEIAVEKALAAIPVKEADGPPSPE
jgi:hypothetical protein